MNKYDTILLAMADGKPIQILRGLSWSDAEDEVVYACMSREFDPQLFRVKPSTERYKTSYTGKNLWDMWIDGGRNEGSEEAHVRVANLVIKRFCEDNDITLEE